MNVSTIGKKKKGKMHFLPLRDSGRLSNTAFSRKGIFFFQQPRSQTNAANIAIGVEFPPPLSKRFFLFPCFLRVIQRSDDEYKRLSCSAIPFVKSEHFCQMSTEDHRCLYLTLTRVRPSYEHHSFNKGSKVLLGDVRDRVDARLNSPYMSAYSSPVLS